MGTLLTLGAHLVPAGFLLGSWRGLQKTVAVDCAAFLPAPAAAGPFQGHSVEAGYGGSVLRDEKERIAAFDLRLSTDECAFSKATLYTTCYS